jgi:hypothetical protein
MSGASTDRAAEEVPTALVFTGPDAHALFVERAVITHDFFHKDAFELSPFQRTHTFIDRYDLTSPSAVASFEVSPLLRILDVSPSGKLVAFQGGAGIDRLDVWAEQKGAFAFRFAAHPFGNAKSALKQDLKTFYDPSQVIWAACIDDSHILALSAVSEFVLIDLPSASIVWHALIPSDVAHPDPWGRVAFRHRSMPALSPDRKTAAIGTANAIRFLDTLSGKITNALPLEQSAVGAPLGFSHDGGRRAALLPGDSFVQVRAVDLHDGKSLADFPAPIDDPHMPGPMLLTGDNLLLPNGLLFSLSKQAPFYHYSRAGDPRNPSAWDPDMRTGSVNPYDRLFYVVKESPFSNKFFACNVQIPDPPALAAAASLNPDTLFAVHPGSSVRLELDVVGDDTYRQQQLDIWKLRLKGNGLTVDDAAPLRLHVHNLIVVGKSATLKSSSPRINSPEESVNAHNEYPGYDITLFDAKNTSLWHVEFKSSDAAPFLEMIHRKPDESAQEAWDREHPPLKQASTIIVPPRYIYARRVMPHSELTAKGAVPFQPKAPIPIPQQ